MRITPPDFNPRSTDHLLIAYVADLELEVDRLRKQGHFFRHAVSEELTAIRAAIGNGALGGDPSTNVSRSVDELAAVMHDLDDPLSYHPAHDQVIAIAVKPLIEQVFRWQQRLSEAPRAILHMELSTDYINWFPGRFRHVLDNLISNALKYRDPDKGEARVTVLLNNRAESIELRVTDNGPGLPSGIHEAASELFYRAAPLRNAGVGVGLSVVKLLLEQSGGSLTVESGEGKGSNFIAILPRYDVGDYLT